MQFAPAERERHKIALPIRNNGVARTKRIHTAILQGGPKHCSFEVLSFNPVRPDIKS